MSPTIWRDSSSGSWRRGGSDFEEPHHDVVPAKAGTHTPCPIERTRRMGPGSSAGTTEKSHSINANADFASADFAVGTGWWRNFAKLARSMPPACEQKDFTHAPSRPDQDGSR